MAYGADNVMVRPRIRHVGCIFFRFFQCLCVITANIKATERITAMIRYTCIPNEINGKLLVFELKDSARISVVMKTFGAILT